ncbi:type I restriction endonuclease subunit R [Kroppenstedtia eburnea]|uniref:type I restriction endonuclease subunit R n=1 Tax=Kroppenstedtia eburnea TaxID=714067 RepID=UPI00363EFCD1
MPVDQSERALEETIERYLIEEGGYVKGEAKEYDVQHALFPRIFFTFIRTTQPKAWQRLEKMLGEGAEKKVLERLSQALNRNGTLKVLRRGFEVYGEKLKTVYFAPASGLNPTIAEKYGQNILTVTRQVYYSQQYKKSLDMVLSVNGLPVATVELKNPFTGQTVEDAKGQYRRDRDPRERLFRFKQRALVHFAVDPDQVYMATRLAGEKTFFLPFNRGYQKGAGNPPDPEGGFRTSYLWREVWQRDSWLDILHRFLHLEVEEKLDGKGEVIRKETMIFPRYHQLDAVRKLERHAREHGAGHNYLIQHSAGSGKSNSIAWLAHRLAHLHGADDRPVFDSVIVITDRRVLDQQLQETIYQFEHRQGVVRKIDEDSGQLAQALNRGARIIISTLQKFGYILDQVEEQTGKNFAILVDEAHSSQSGQSAQAVRDVLAAPTLEAAAELEERLGEAENAAEEEILKALSKRGPQANLSFFAFTATPKAKTLELFGVKKDPESKPEPFHLYSMKQAIEEGFIHDVLKHYTTYRTYYRLSKIAEDDPRVDKKKARKAIARFVSLHPHNLAQKTEVMVEHFRQITRHKINGRAKAMVVTGSRLHALRYKREFENYIKRNGYEQELKVLVAFSGTVRDGDEDFTEAKENGFPESELRERFDTDEYQLLIVADKYQTGFDQPLLHTMFVDKKLTGIQAVQTLSRLNRTHPAKTDTFVLDFVNEQEEIQKSFQPFYEQTMIDKETDPHLVYDLKSKLDDFQIYWESEVESFCHIFFKPKENQRREDLGELHKYLDPAVDRFQAKPEEEQEEFKKTLETFVRLYAHISQIAPFQSVELHQLHAYGSLLLRKLPRSPDSGGLTLDNEVELEYYRLEKTAEGRIHLIAEESAALKGATAAGTARGRGEEEEVPLSSIIEMLNERFGTDFAESDKLFLDQIEEDLLQDEEVVQAAQNNTKSNFRYVFDDKFMGKAVNRMGQNQNIFAKLMSEEDFRDTVMTWILDSVYQRAQQSRQQEG